MKQGKSEIILILDRSGSMSDIARDMEGGIKSYIDKQKLEPGECHVSLYQFDSVYDAVFEHTPIASVGAIKLVPRGSTALLDAIGKTINSVGERLSNTAESERPESVIVTVITDGHENASREFTSEKVRELITHQTSVYNWKFIFLGANQDAVLAGTSMGYSAGTSMTYAATSQGVGATFMNLCSATSAMRAMPSADYAFSDDERDAAMGGTAGGNVQLAPNVQVAPQQVQP
jgi:uncharacterized protein YegL